MADQCSYCGVLRRIYEEEGHNKECAFYETGMYHLAHKWLNSNEYDVLWKPRFDLIVRFLLDRKVNEVSQSISSAVPKGT